MPHKNPILDANNEPINLSNLFGRLATTTMDGLPIGSAGDSTQGEIGVKVIIIGGNSNTGGFVIPAYDSITFTYVGATNNVHTQVFKSGATTVATLTYTYAAAGVADNDKVTLISQS